MEGKGLIQGLDAAAPMIHKSFAGIFSDHCIRP